MSAIQTRRSRAFSLIELVIVVVIIGIIAAIAIPRMSRGAAGAADSSLTANLAVLRNAIDLFQSEHGGTFPSGTSANVIAQLTTYTDDACAPVATKDATHIFGPYLRSVPKLPVGANKGDATFTVVTTGAFSFSGTTGWWYHSGTGDVKANTNSEADARGVAYNTY
jgi:general secretion pathway protein G